jgi:hypothetical protein
MGDLIYSIYYANEAASSSVSDVDSSVVIRILLGSHTPITVAARSKAWTVFARSNTGIVGSNSTQGMDVCMPLFCLCCSVCRYRPYEGLILRPRSPTDLLRLRNWSETKRFTVALRSKWEQQERESIHKQVGNSDIPTLGFYFVMLATQFVTYPGSWSRLTLCHCSLSREKF